MKKRKLKKLALNRESISKLNAEEIKGGKGSDCAGTCTCECSNDCTEQVTCSGEESECLPCYSEIQ